MTAATWPQVTCTACGATGPGRAKAGLCKRCYARAQHPVQACGGCGQTRRHLAAGLCARCYRLSLTRLATCAACGQERPVCFGDRCERCKRRAAAKAGACAECGKQVARLWSGCCRSCHARRYQTTGACADCGDLTLLASGLCSPCRLFRWKHPVVGLCAYCGRQQPIGAAEGCRSCQAALRAARALARARRKRRIYASSGACQDCGDLARLISGLCGPCRQFRSTHPLGTCPLLRAAAAHRRRRRLPALPGRAARRLRPHTGTGQTPGYSGTDGCQLAAPGSHHPIRQRPGLGAQHPAVRPPRPGSRADRRRRPRPAPMGRRAAAPVPGRPSPGGAAGGGVPHRRGPGMRQPPRRARPVAGTPARRSARTVRRRGADLDRGAAWPRPRAGRPRHPRTIEAYLRVLEAPLATWSARYGSLHEVTTEDLTAQLDTVTGATRRLAMAAMRSLFTTLKARRVLFTNPAAPLTGRALPPPPVLPLDAARRAGLLSGLDQPAQRLIVLLAGVHALRPSQICALTLDAVGPGATTLLIGGRSRPLDKLTASHLRAWLHARHARWPATANPHLLINRSTADGLNPADRGYVQATVRRAGITAAELRADRLLDEACATGGDPLALTHLFGISDPTAIRYCAELDQVAPPSAAAQGPQPRRGGKPNQ